MRTLPRPGLPVTVLYLDAEVPATVTEVAQEGRVVTVRTKLGELMEFRLSPATAAFVTADQCARLRIRAASP